jgi:DNA invertase Pin-like site-specific DNA recombinase
MATAVVRRAPAKANPVAPTARQRAIIYCRVSGTNQEDNGSLNDQEKRCRAWCTDHDATVVEVYREVYNAKNIYRPKLAQVRARAEAHEFNALVVDKTDRLSRGGPYDTAFLRRELQENGVTVIILNAPDESPTQELVNSVMEWSDRYERERLIERTYGGRVRRARGEGKEYGILGARSPKFGYRRSEDGTRYLPDDNPGPRAVLLWAIRELAEAQPPKSVAQVVHEMDGLHLSPYAYYQSRAWLPATANVGKHWSKEALRRIVWDDAYIGGYKAFRTMQVPVTNPRPRPGGFVPKDRTRVAPRAPDDPLLTDQSDLCPPLFTAPQEVG